MTWQAGDLALCVDASPESSTQNVLIEQGRIYRVVAVAITRILSRPALNLEGVIGWDGLPAEYRQSRFRKVLPDKAEQCEPEFVTLLKRSKVTASGTPTRRAETTGSVGEADGGPVPKADAQ